MLLTLFLAGLLDVVAEGAQFFRDVWNPIITVLPFVLLVLRGLVDELRGGVGTAGRRRRGTFLVQTHVSYGLVTTALLLAGRRRCGHHRVATTRPTDHHAERVRSWLRMLVVTVAVGAVLWLPVVVQQVRDEPGNLGKLIRFFRDHGREHSYGDAWHVVAAQLSVWPDWVHGNVVRNIYSGALDLSGADAGRGVGAACSSSPPCSRGDGRRTPSGSTSSSRLTIVVAVVSVSRIVGDIFPYLVTWTWAVGMLTWLAIAWSVVRWWQTPRRVGSPGRSGRARRRRRRTRGREHREHGRRGDRGQPRSDRFASGGGTHRQDPRRAAVRRRRGRDPSAAPLPDRRGSGSGIAAQLERDGIDTRVSPDLGFAYGPDRVLGDEQVRLVVLPVEQPDLAATRELPCFEDAGRVEKFTLFLGDPECINRG